MERSSSPIETVSPPAKDYSTGTTPIHSPLAPSRTQGEYPFPDKHLSSVSRPITLFVEKPATDTLGNSSTSDDTTTEAAVSGFSSLPFTEQQWNALQTVTGARNATPGSKILEESQGSPSSNVDTSTNG